MVRNIRFGLILGALALVCVGLAQDVPEYMRMRKQLGVKQAVTVEALNKMTGSHAVELKGRVKGTFSANGITEIMVDLEDGTSVTVEANPLPQWLENNDVPARLLTRVSRSAEQGSLHATLIAAAPEGNIAKIEAAEAAKAAKNNQPSVNANPKGGGLLHGRIGRGGSFSGQSTPQNWNLAASKATPVYAGFIKKQNPKLSDREAYKIAQGVIGFSLQHGVDARLIMAIVMVESGFDPASTSNKGAMGLGQLMPETAKWMNVSNAYDTNENLYGSVKLMRHLLESYQTSTGDSYRSLVLALAAYNAGEGAVKRAGGVPYASTQRYVDRIIGLYRQFCGE